MKTNETLILLNLDAGKGGDFAFQWLDMYACFILVGQDLELLDSAAVFLENEGKEVYIAKDIDDLLSILAGSESVPIDEKPISVFVY